MFIHNFKYALKTLFKNKMLIFWTFAFPIILGVFFKMAFSNIENSEKLDIIDIAIVENKDFIKNEPFKEAFKELGNKENKDRLFNIEYVTENKATKLLADKKIAGYLLMKKDEPHVIVSSSGIDETILKNVTEEISQSSKVIYDTINHRISKGLKQKDYSQIIEKVLKMTENVDGSIKDISDNNLSETMIEYYTLIAMACLYGGILGMVAINQCLPNMTNNGKRVSVSPTPRWVLVGSSVLAGYVTQLIGLLLLFLFTIFALKVDYGDNLLAVILLAMVGSLAGLTLGIAIASTFKVSENSKTGIVISITMLGCFLSGMMGITMKYIIDKNIPIINKLNPAAMITDGFYSLYYYDTLDRYYVNVISLLIFSFIMMGIAVFSLGRRGGKYDSI